MITGIRSNPAYQAAKNVMSWIRLMSALASLCLLWPSLGVSQELHCHAPMQPWRVAVLYFGSDIKHRQTVSDQMFEIFEKNEIIPRFPELTTVTEGTGRYRYKDGQFVAEHTRIVTFYFKDEAAGDKLLDQIVSEYKSAFQQEAVGREERGDCAAFQ